MELMKYCIYSFLILLLLGCATPVEPDQEIFIEEIVVEGYIEAGPGANPPFVLLSRSTAFLDSISAENINEAIIRDARVRIDDGTDSYELTPICLSTLDSAIATLIRDQLRLPATSALDPCVYLDVSNSIIAESGSSYRLLIEVDDLVLTAETKIPDFIPLEDFEWSDAPGTLGAGFRQLKTRISDPVDTLNYYRYLTSINDGPFLAGLASVTDDALFDGQSFDVTLQKSEPPGEPFDDEYGLYEVGDTVGIRWMTLDEQHFDFWNTLEFSRANQGPFAGYTRVRSNISGGIGIWGGAHVDIYNLIVE